MYLLFSILKNETIIITEGAKNNCSQLRCS